VSKSLSLGEGWKSLPITELVTRGARLSPFEDFRERTLSALSGLWTKLLYMAELRSSDGTYCHWGHSHVYGEARSQAALARAHSELYIALLRSPIRELVEEIENSGGNDQKEIFRNIVASRERMIPKNLEGGSPRHFNSIALAVRLVCEHQRASNHSAA